MSGSLFYRGDEPVPIPNPKAIQPAEKPSAPPRAVAEPPVVEMQYANRSRNSRLGVPVGTGMWKTAWHSPLASAMQPPAVLLAAADRMLVCSNLAWELFDAVTGRSIATQALGAGGATLDPEWKLFYFPDQHGRIAAHQMTDGRAAYTMLPLQTTDAGRRLMARVQSALISVSYQLGVDAHAPPPQYSIAERTNLIGPDNRKSWDEGGPSLTHELVAHNGRLLPAIRATTLAVTMDDTLAFIDANTLDPRAVFTGSFQPLSLSLDEARRAYLLVSAGGQTALWQVSPAGERLYSCPMPPGFTGASAPPIIAYDHTAYIVSGRFILSVARDGKLNWSREANGSIGGAAVTTDDQLVTSEDTQIAAWNAKGERRVLHTFPEPILTAPVLTPQGLFAASRTKLYYAAR